MNIEEKTKMAHEYFRDVMAFIRKEDINHDLDLIIEESWRYADAMEAEAEKRIKAKVDKYKEDAKVFFEELNSADSSQLEFQVDWGVAPEWAVYWFMDETLAFWWSKREPYFLAGGVSKIVINNVNSFAPSFNYQGDWKDSLRKRPQ